jgi:hypothetical protein
MNSAKIHAWSGSLTALVAYSISASVRIWLHDT